MTSPGRNRVLFFVASSGGLPPTETTFAKALQTSPAKYNTALFGKWHLGLDCDQKGDGCHHPNSHGFDYFFGTPLTNLKDYGDDGDSVITSYFPRLHLLLLCTALLGLAVGLGLKMAQWTFLSVIILVLTILAPTSVLIFQKNIRTINAVLYRNSELIEQPLNLEGFTGRLVDEAEAFIRKQSKNKDQPFLAMINFLKVHTAHFPSSQFAGKSKYGKYGDSVLELDASVGRVLNLLQELELFNNTFVYFSSDNGGHLEEVNLEGVAEGGSNGRLRGGKGHGAMEGGIRVPAFAMWPSVIPQRRVIDVPTSQMDFYPTLLEISGKTSLPDNQIMDGKSIWSLLTGNSSISPHNVLFHYCGTYLHGLRIVDGDHVWKVYYYTPKYKESEEKCLFVCMCYGENVVEHRPPLIYDIAADLSEREPLSPKTKVYEKVLEKAEKAVEEHMKSLVANVESQFSFLKTVWKPWLQPCCTFPFCRC